MSDPSLLQGGHRVAKRRSLGQSSVPAKLTEPSNLPPSSSPSSQQLSTPASPPQAPNGGKAVAPANRGVVSSEPVMKVAQAVRMLEKKANQQQQQPAAPGASKSKKMASSAPKKNNIPKEPTFVSRVPAAVDRLSAVTVSDTTASPHGELENDDDIVSVDSLAMNDYRTKGPSSVAISSLEHGLAANSVRGGQEHDESSSPNRQMVVDALQNESTYELEEVLPIRSSTDGPLQAFPLAHHVSSFAPTNLEISHVTSVDGHQHTHIDTDNDDDDDALNDDKPAVDKRLPALQSAADAQSASPSCTRPSVEVPVEHGSPEHITAAAAATEAENDESPTHHQKEEEDLATTVLLSSRVFASAVDADREETDPNRVIDEKWLEQRRHEHPTASTFAPHTPLSQQHAHGHPQRHGFATTEAETVTQRPETAPTSSSGSAEVHVAIASPVLPSKKIDESEFEDEGGVPGDVFESSMSAVLEGDDGAAKQDGRARSTSGQHEQRFSGGVDPNLLDVDPENDGREKARSIDMALNELPKVLLAKDISDASGTDNDAKTSGDLLKSREHQEIALAPEFACREVGLRFNNLSRVIRPLAAVSGVIEESLSSDDEESESAALPFVQVKVIAPEKKPNDRGDLTVPPVILETPRVATVFSADVPRSSEESDVDWKESLRPTLRSPTSKHDSIVKTGHETSDGQKRVAGPKTNTVSRSVISDQGPSSSPSSVQLPPKHITPTAATSSDPLHPVAKGKADSSSANVQTQASSLSSSKSSPARPLYAERRDVSPDGRKFAVSSSSLMPARPITSHDSWIISNAEEAPSRILLETAPAHFSARKKLISPAMDLSPPTPTLASEPETQAVTAAVSNSGLDEKARRMRNMQQALATIDARYGAKMKEIQQQQTVPAAVPTGYGNEPQTGHRAVDQFAQGLESMLRELRRTSAPARDAAPRVTRGDVVEPHLFKVVR